MCCAVAFSFDFNLCEMQDKPRNTFPKAEHLFGKTATENLFARGTAFVAYPVRVVFLAVPKEKDSDVPARLMVSAPKKRFKHAVDRNRLKRLMREAYRINKAPLFAALEGKDYQLHFSFNYIADKVEDFRFVEKKVRVALDKLIKKLP